MAAIYDTAYPRLKYNLTKKEIIRIYTPLDEEIIWANSRRFKREQFLLCLVYIKYFQRLGHFPKTREIPLSVVIHIASFTRYAIDESFQFPSIPNTTLKRIKDSVRKYAFRELGRVVRTQFLLEYIGDIEIREMIQAAACKSEEFNNFIKWVFFFNNGEIQENLRHEQDKVVRYNHLIANQIILHNVNSMTKVLTELKKEGHSITGDVYAGLSPYRTEHINLLGDYTIDTAKRMGKCFTKL